MGKITINRERCKGCLLCMGFCPRGSIAVDTKLNRRGVKPALVKKNSECIGCAMCAIICPDCCIEVYR